MNSTLQIGDRTVGRGLPMYLIAEVGLAHDGSLGAAHAYVDAAADSGVDAIKFQTHIPSEESSRFEQFRVKVFPQDETRYDYWQRTAFTKQQWLELAKHCRESGIDFLSSPFSGLAVEWLEECSVKAWKVASGEVTNLPMLEKMVATKKPILVSSGMSSWQELDWVIESLRAKSAACGLFQCTTAYPCPPENWGLNVVSEMMDRYHCPVGFSDHSGTIFPGIAARMLGASFLEFHITFHKSQFGPDTKASLTLEQTGQLVEGIRSIESSFASPIDKDLVASELSETRKLFSKGLFARKDLNAGELLTFELLDFRKPLKGIPANDYQRFIGRVLKIKVPQGEPLTENCFIEQ